MRRSASGDSRNPCSRSLAMTKRSILLKARSASLNSLILGAMGRERGRKDHQVGSSPREESSSNPQSRMRGRMENLRGMVFM